MCITIGVVATTALLLTAWVAAGKHCRHHSLVEAHRVSAEQETREEQLSEVWGEVSSLCAVAAAIGAVIVVGVLL